MKLNSYRDLVAWQKAMDLVVAGYALAERMPKTETYALASQLRRAATSVPANIAEGRSRRRTKEFLHHLDIAYGSLGEAETHVYVAIRLNYFEEKDACGFLALSAEVGRLLNGLIKSLEPDAYPDC